MKIFIFRFYSAVYSFIINFFLFFLLTEPQTVLQSNRQPIIIPNDPISPLCTRKTRKPIGLAELSMKDIDMYNIPKQYIRIELEDSTEEFRSLETLMNLPRTEKIYILLTKAMIFLEEAAATESLREFDLENVILKVHNQKNQTIKITQTGVSEIIFSLVFFFDMC